MGLICFKWHWQNVNFPESCINKGCNRCMCEHRKKSGEKVASLYEQEKWLMHKKRVEGKSKKKNDRWEAHS